jgi:hypothetical protein
MGVEALLRTDLAARMQGLTLAVQGGVMTPNEARKLEGLSPVAGGDSALQRQMTPVNLLSQLATADLARGATAPASSRLRQRPVGVLTHAKLRSLNSPEHFRARTARSMSASCW